MENYDQLVRTSPRFSTENSDVLVTIQPPSSVNGEVVGLVADSDLFITITSPIILNKRW